MAVNNSLTQKKATPSLTAYLNNDAVRAQINSIVGSKRGTAFITSIVSAVQANPTLKECTNSSILSAALLGESLNLSPSAALGQFWLIPYNNKKEGVREAQFQLGANGFKQLAMRTGQYKDIDFIEVHEGEYKGRDKYTGKQTFEFIENEDERETLPVIGYMAYFELTNGFRKSVFWTVKKMEEHANRYSQAFNLEAYRKIQRGEMPQSEMWKYSSYWYTNFSGMAEKTLVKHLLSKYGILSTELVNAADADGSVIREDGTRNYVEMEETIVETSKEEKTPSKTPDKPPVEDNPTESTPKTEKAESKADNAAAAALFGGNA